MFGRKNGDAANTGTTAQAGSETPLPLKSKPGNVAPLRGSAPPVPTTRREVPHPGLSIAPRSTPASEPTTFADGSTLVVGRDIVLNGSIDSCDKLVVEGRVEADLEDCREVFIAETGAYSGKAKVAIAEIRGRFDGTLEASDLLLIHGSGRVSGTVRYGKLEIERGGEIAGDVKAVGDDDENGVTGDGTATS